MYNNVFNINNHTFILDSFESSALRIFYLEISNVFTLILSSSIIYMFINLLLFIFIINQVSIMGITNNIVFVSLQFFIVSLYDIVKSYFRYKYNVLFLIIGYIFLYLLLNNLIGLIPFSNTINNHFNITGMLSFTCWLGIIFIGLKYFSTRLFSMFCVMGIPTLLIPFLALIEIVSYSFRFISLSLRLFANIVAGHILLETIYIFLFKSTLCYSTSVSSFLLILVPSIFFIILILFESIIAILQSYIFIVLCLIYLKDSLYLH